MFTRNIDISAFSKLRRIKKFTKLHTKGIESVCVLSEHLICTSGDDSKVLIINIHTGKVVRRVKHHRFIKKAYQKEYITKLLEFTDEKGKLLVIMGSFMGYIQVYDCLEGKIYWKVPKKKKHEGTIWDMVQLDQRVFASCSNDKKVRFFDMRRKKAIGVYSLAVREGNYLYSLAMTNYHTLAIGGGGKYEIHVVDVKEVLNGKIGKIKLKYTLKGHKSGVWSVLCVKERNLLVSGSSDNSIRVWCLKKVMCIRILDLHQEAVCSLGILRCGGDMNEIVVGGGNDGLISFWNIVEGRLLKYVNVKEDRSQIWDLRVLKNMDLVVVSSDTSVSVINTHILFKGSTFITNLVKKIKKERYINIIIMCK